MAKPLRLAPVNRLLDSQEPSVPNIVRTLRLWALFAAEALVADFFSLPSHLNFNHFAFGDGGFNLTVQFLVRQGYSPVIDFGFPYGALSLLFGRAWFALFGLTPAAYFAAIVVCDVIFALALARFANRLRLHRSGIALILAALPFAILLTITFAHALERVLLSSALAEHAAGKRANSLALATAAIFTKPSMGYVYGLLLLLFMLRASRPLSYHSIYQYLRALMPAAITGLCLAVLLSAAYRVPVVVHTLFPISGHDAYRANNFGFFGAGSAFWYFSGVHLGYYLGTGVSFWFGATILVIFGGCYAALRLLHRSKSNEGFDLNYELVVSCAVMQTAFIAFFFGSNASWTSYAYIPMMGVAAMCAWGGSLSRAGWALVLIGAVGQKSMLTDNFHRWREMAPSREMAGMWAMPDEHREWVQILAIIDGHSAIALVGDGAVQLLFEGFNRPVVGSYIHGQTTSGELARGLRQLAGSTVVVVPRVVENSGFLKTWPEFSEALSGWSVVWRSPDFVVYERPAISRGGAER